MENENEESGQTAGDETIVDSTTDTQVADTSAEDAAAAAAASTGPKSLLEAVSAGVDSAQKPARIVPKADEIAAGDTRPRNADGTFKTETAEEKATREEMEEAARLAAETPEQKAARLAAETPEQKAAREAKEAAAAKKADPINDPIPEGLNKRTSERMKSLIDTVKAQQALVAQHDELFGAIQSTGASPDEFAAMVNYMKGVRGNDPKILEQAYQMLQGELRGLAVRMGKPLYEVNLLRDATNQDLVAEVTAGKLTNARAHEIALQRETAKRNATIATRERQVATTQQQDETAAATGRADLNALTAELRAKDGDAVYDAKHPILAASLKKLLTRIDPKEWRNVARDMYNDMPTPDLRPSGAVVPTHAAAIVPKQQPLRTKTPAGAGSTAVAPKSALDAISQALDGM